MNQSKREIVLQKAIFGYKIYRENSGKKDYFCLVYRVSPELLARIPAAAEKLLADEDLLRKALKTNEWFLPALVRQAVRAMYPWFTEARLQNFIGQYPTAPKPLSVGIIMAGNLPLVGLHDLLCVLLSGHSAVVKLSSKDPHLLPALCAELPSALPVRFVTAIDPLEIDFLLATGSDNTARYLEHRFANVQRIVRRNRYSIAVLNGRETAEDLDGLARDILLYHGMGCRSVAAVLTPEGFDAGPLAAALDRFPAEWLAPGWQAIQSWESALAQMEADKLPKLACQQATLQQRDALQTSRIGVVHLVPAAAPNKLLAAAQQQLQCVVGHDQKVGFGQSQFPDLEEFADGVDVMRTLAEV